MKILNVTRTYRNIMRVKEILQVLIKHGFGHIVARLNLTIYLPSLRHLGILTDIPSYLSEDSPAVRVRLVLQELGPTFVKLGQLLSSRPDLIPDNFIQELRLLQDKVAPFPVEEALNIIKEEFNTDSSQIYSKFDKKVLASGSIGQVHCAELSDGTKVIVKIKRPEIEKVIATDIAILRFFAELAEKYIEELRIFQPIMIVEEFSRTIQREMDFTAEAAYTEKFYNLLQKEEYIYSPKVFWEYTTSNIITLERIKGIKIDEYELLKSKGIDLKLVSKRFISSFMKQYFVWGLFHADPHPGNILVGENGEIYLVDFGMVGHLSEDLKAQLSTIVIALLKNDIQTIIEVYADIGVFTGNINERELKTDILELIDKYFNTPFQHLDIGKVFQDIVRLARNHKILLPRDFILLGKSLVMSTSIARELDPDFNLAKAASPHVSAILREKFSPKRILNMSLFQIWSFYSLFQKLPSEIKELLRKIKTGNICVTLRHESLDKYIQDLDKIANRLSFSIILASIVIASSILTMARVGPKFQNIPLLGLVGYLLAAILGFWLVIAILRSGKL